MIFNSIQNQRLEIMREIAKAMSKEDAILKGGTALLLCYGLDRFSEDMDFDGYGSFNFERIQKVISNAITQQGSKVTQVIIKKDTPTTKRAMFHYEVAGKPQYAYPLKVEFSFRQSSEIETQDYTLIDDIKVYNIDKLVEKKFAAFIDRTAPRDIYDVAFLMEHYPKSFSKEILRQICSIDLDGLVSSFESAKLDDDLVSYVDSIELIFGLAENAAEQIKQLEKDDFEM